MRIWARSSRPYFLIAPLDYIPKVCIPRAIPPRCRGVSDQRLQTRGGERWPGQPCIGDAMRGPAVQAASGPARLVCAPRSLTAGRPGRPVRRTPAECLASSVGKRGAAPTGITRLKCDHRGRCGASLKHRARDAFGLADLRHALPIARTRAKRRGTRTSTSLDVARRRGPRVLYGPLASRAPSVLFRAMRIFSKTTAYPAPQRNRAIALAWREQLL